MKKSFSKRLAYRIRKISFSLLHRKFVKLYSERFNKNLSQSELEFCVENLYQFHLGKKLDLKSPKSFNEKLNWLKCFYHDDRMRVCADKVTAPAYFKDKTGYDDSFIVKNLYDEQT